MRGVDFTTLMLAAFGVALAACYTLQPARATDARVGTRVAFDVNDAGRVALGGSMGPEISQVEGRLISADNAEYDVAVSAVRFLDGGEQVWRGDRVRIKAEFVKSAYERRFSSGRTAALGASLVGGVAAYIVGRSLIGSGAEGPGTPRDSGAAFRRP
ncbi:MAG TPA: hypothetical protein VIF32_05515 [Gemmatimonadaceae bacterium]